MAGRIRSIKPEWLENERLGSCSNEARLLSVALLLLADDHGRGRAAPAYIASQVWPYETHDVSRAGRALAELADIGYVRLYRVEGQSYFEIPGWERHQRVDKPGKARVPAHPANIPEIPANIPGSLAPDLEHRSIGEGRREKGEGSVAAEPPHPDFEVAEGTNPGGRKKPSRPMPPGWSPGAVHLEIARASGVDAKREEAKFRDWAIAKGQQYASWDAAFSNWLRRAGEFRGNGNGASGKPPPKLKILHDGYAEAKAKANGAEP